MQGPVDWALLYARLMTVCGYTTEEIDTMPMLDAIGLLQYWRRWPPVHEILAAVYGIKTGDAVARQVGDPSGIGSLLARFPSGRVTTN